MKFNEEREDKKLAPHIRYVDVYGNVIPGILDTDTNIAVVWEPRDVVDGPRVKKEKFMPGAHAIIDGESNPSEERLEKIREKHNAGHKKE